jgi:hypothetical protein
VFVFILGVCFRGRSAIYGQLVCCLFGAAAAVILPGGASIVPATAFLPFLVVAAWSLRSPAWARQMPISGAWLLAFVAWAVVSAILLPRALEGWTHVMTVDRGSGDTEALIPLRPVSGNVTQTFYVVGGAAVFFAVRELMRENVGVATFRDGMLLLSALNCLAAVLNLAEHYLGLPSLTELTRNAGYVNYSAYEEAGLVRIQGTFSETSAFAAFSLPLFAFCWNLWMRGVRPRYSGTVAMVTLALLLLSTSGTAYGALAIYALAFSLQYALQGMSARRFLRPRAMAVLSLGACAVVGAAIIFELEFADRVAKFFEHTVGNKLSSSSGEVRSSWNRQAWRNFVETYGLGVGAGSARASSFFFVVASNLGVLGLVFFSMFFTYLFSGQPRLLSEPRRVVCIAARHGLVAALIPALLSAGNVSLGFTFFFFAAGATLTNLSARYFQ